MKKIDLSSIDKKILSLKPPLISEIQQTIKNEGGEGELDDYKVVRNQLQRIASPTIVRILKEAFPKAKFTIAEKKSTFSDVKMELNGFKIAIDVKSNESSKDLLCLKMPNLFNNQKFCLEIGF